jgi:hypothetical protein
VAENGERTCEACDMAEEDNVEGEDWKVDGETPHGWVPQLHRKDGDEHHRKEISPMSGSRR